MDLHAFVLGQSYGWRHTARAVINSVCEFKYRYQPPRPIKHRFDGWMLDYCFSEGFEYRIGSWATPWVRRNPNEACLYTPGTVHWERCLQPHGHGAYVKFWLNDGPWFSYNARASIRFGMRFQDPEGVLAAVIREAVEIGQGKGKAGFWEEQSCLCRILPLLFTADLIGPDLFRLRSRRAAFASPFVTQVRAYLTEHLHERVHLPDLARAMGLSVSPVSRRYRRETGETPLMTHTRLRIARAKTMLTMGTPLKQIAEDLGFCDIYHLSRCFKRIEDVSPRHYLKRLAAC